jgi:hypothetical protein
VALVAPVSDMDNLEVSRPSAVSPAGEATAKPVSTRKKDKRKPGPAAKKPAAAPSPRTPESAEGPGTLDLLT